MEQSEIERSVWTFEHALKHCTKHLADFQATRGADIQLCRSATILEAVEASPFVRLGQPCVAPNGRISQEILMEKTILHELLQQAKSEIWPFLVVREIGMSCVESGNLDLQPRALADFLKSLLSGKGNAQGRAPKTLIYKGRDALIRALVQGLTLHGFLGTRNDVSSTTSACDVVARACIAAGIPGVTSYETIKKIHLSRA